jgi:hypothetical protein
VGESTTSVPDPIAVTVKSVGTGPVYGIANEIVAAAPGGTVAAARPFTLIDALEADRVYVPDPGTYTSNSAGVNGADPYEYIERDQGPAGHALSRRVGERYPDLRDLPAPLHGFHPAYA